MQYKRMQVAVGFGIKRKRVRFRSGWHAAVPGPLAPKPNRIHYTDPARPRKDTLPSTRRRRRRRQKGRTRPPPRPANSDAMADDDDAAVLSDVDEDPLPPPSSSAASHKTLPQAQPRPQPDAQAQQRLLDLAAELDEERRLRRAAEASLAESESRLARLKAFAQDVLRKRDDLTAEAAASARSVASLQAEAAASARSLAALQAESAASARSLAALQAEAATASSMLSSGFERISAKASPSSVPAPLPTSQKYSSGLPALAYGVLKRANDIVDDLLAQIDAANRDRDRAREQMEHRNYQIAIEVSELEASLASRSAECESLSKSLSQREAEISELRDKIASLEGKLDAQRPVLAEQIGCASKLYDEMREVVKLVDAAAASALSDSVFVWKETDVEESLKVSLEGTRLAYELAAMALEKVGVCIDDKETKLRGLEDRVDELIREKEHIGVLLRSALSATTSEVLKVAEDGLREAGIEIGLDERKEHRPGSLEKDEVYTLAGALENTMKESQVKIVELQHLVQALRAESGLLRTRLEGQEKEIGQLRKQIKHLEEKERVANESVEGLMMDVTAAEEEIKRWKMAAEEEAEAGRSIEQEFQIQISSLRKELDEAKQAMVELENKLKFKEETAAAAMAARDAAEKSLKLADMRSSRLRERLEELNRQLEESDSRTDSVNRNGHRLAMIFSTFFLLFWTVFAWTTRLKRVAASGRHGSPAAQRPYARIDRNYDTLDQVKWALQLADLESSNLIIGVDFTKSNEWTGKRCFDGRSLHHLGGPPNPYEQAISIIAKTLSGFDEDNKIPCFGFGDSKSYPRPLLFVQLPQIPMSNFRLDSFIERWFLTSSVMFLVFSASTHDQHVFSFYPDARACNGVAEALQRYREIAPHVRLSGPTSLAPIIETATKVVQDNGYQYHILLIIADGQVPTSSSARYARDLEETRSENYLEERTLQALIHASDFPLSIVLVGVGDGPWDDLIHCNDNRRFDNFQFVNFTEIMSKEMSQGEKEDEFALEALMKIPAQHDAVISQNISELTARAPTRTTLPPPC
ncbi:hypothetical protein U9M48_012775 [Paspalum notatum var. saurae]|uniref:Copine C-terminal domain-containing protein n=1 Tax=Paspalum notatum var. saurae TaxID=547442 RepID=A0AAQ3SZ52_PASNO